LGEERLLQVSRQVEGLNPDLQGGKEKAEVSQPVHRQALGLGDAFTGPRGQVDRVGEARQARPHGGETGGDLFHGLHLSRLHIIRMIEVAQFADQFTGLGLPCLGLRLFGFGGDQRGQGRLNLRREGRWPAARMA